MFETEGHVMIALLVAFMVVTTTLEAIHHYMINLLHWGTEE